MVSLTLACGSCGVLIKFHIRVTRNNTNSNDNNDRQKDIQKVYLEIVCDRRWTVVMCVTER